MGEPAASMRPLNGAEEFDRRVRSLTQNSPHADALAELARLVDSQGLFGAFQAASQATPSHGQAAEGGPAAAGSDFEAFGEEFGLAQDADLARDIEAGAESGVSLDPATHFSAPPLQDWERAVPRYPSVAVHDQRPIEASPDVWVQGVDDGDHDAGDGPVLTATREQPPSEGSNPKRTLMVLAAVIVLTAGGLGASFLARPTASGVITAAATPTIMAASGPSKVQPEAAPTGDDAPSEPSKLLDKNKNDGTAEAKIVSATEEPVDLNQAVKPSSMPDSGDAAAPPAAPPSGSAFPEPRKVKTILVRPDGSIIPTAAPSPTDAAVPPSPDQQQASLAFDPTTAIPHAAPDAPPAAADTTPTDATPAVNPVAVAMPTAAQPAPDAPKPTGKTTARVIVAKPAASTTQDASAAAQARSTVATPKAKPVVHAKPKPKPAAPVQATEASAAVADATPTATTPAPAAPAGAATSGSFAVQLGAAPTEAEGQAAAARLGQQYASDLGGAAPAVRKAQAGGKTVFRIRVGDLSQDAAKAICAKVKAGGGGCFVARN